MSERGDRFHAYPTQSEYVGLFERLSLVIIISIGHERCYQIDK